jgi:hypothetical protein
MPVSKILNIQGSGTWQGTHGLMYQFDYNFEDGTAIQASHKTQNSPFQVGQEALYEVKRETQYGKSGSVKKPESAQYQGGQTNGYKKSSGVYTGAKDRSLALSYAKDIIVADIAAGRTPNIQDVLFMADKFLNWLENKPAEQPQQQTPPAQIQTQPAPEVPVNQFDGLPF